MQTKTPPPMPSVVKKEDKMDTLRTFIGAALAAPRSADDVNEITLIARSAESPVARALVSLGGDIAARGLAVRAIFAYLEPEKSADGWSVSGPLIAFQRDLRWAKNPRLADAHEQLVLGPTTAWVGDCLRRDPSRRDAYEQYAGADGRTARILTTSFSRLWAASVPLLIRSPLSALGPVTGDGLAGLAPRDEQGGPMASSPH